MALIAVLTGLAAYRLAPRLNVLSALIGSLLVLSSIRLATFVGYVNPTCLLMFLFSVAFYAATRPQSRATVWVFVVAITVGIFTQAGFFLVGVACAVWLLWRFRREKQAVQLIGAACILLGAVANVALKTRPGDSLRQDTRDILWEANNPYYESMTWWSLWERRPGNYWTKWKMSEQEQRRYSEYLERTGHDRARAALLWVRENPLQYAKLCFVRFRAVLGPITGQMSPINRWISAAMWLIVFPAGFYGLWKNRKSDVAPLAVLIMLTLVGSETLVMAGWQPRYRLPMELMLMAYAGMAYAPVANRLLKLRVSFGLGC